MEFFTEYPVYVVMVIVLIIWLGISLFLWGVDSRIKKIEKDVKSLEDNFGDRID